MDGVEWLIPKSHAITTVHNIVYIFVFIQGTCRRESGELSFLLLFSCHCGRNRNQVYPIRWAAIHAMLFFFLLLLLLLYFIYATHLCFYSLFRVKPSLVMVTKQCELAVVIESLNMHGNVVSGGINGSLNGVARHVNFLVIFKKHFPKGGVLKSLMSQLIL